MKLRRGMGSGYIRVVCDVCGKVIYQKDAVHITDKYNMQYGMVVCRQDVDKTNQQSLPTTIIERGPAHPELLRPHPTETYAVNSNEARSPSAPLNVLVDAHPLNSTLLVTWDGPSSIGTSAISGYKVTRADPQLGAYTTIIANTGNGGTSYEDTTATLTAEYTYIIYAINGNGTGPASYPGFYPTVSVSETVNYLVVSQDESVLTTGDGTYIVVSE